MLESGYGSSRLARECNNHFGIGIFSGGRFVGFRVFGGVEDAFVYLADMLRRMKRYGALFDIPLSDYRGWADGLQACGYSTSAGYGRALVFLIKKYDLSG
jgi:flagellum-specific peptidoglycan hydrolase FlgJ